MKQLWALFFTFAKIGVMTFGGGMAMLPILQREVVEDRGWASDEQMMDYFAIGQCTPGIIAINVATFIGYKQKGVAGAVFATLGMVFPSLVIIMAIAAFLNAFSQFEAVKHAFAGIRVCVCVLILNAVLKLLKSSVIDKITLVIFLAATVLMLIIDLSPIIFVLAAALIGIAVRQIGGKKA